MGGGGQATGAQEVEALSPVVIPHDCQNQNSNLIPKSRLSLGSGCFEHFHCPCRRRALRSRFSRPVARFRLCLRLPAAGSAGFQGSCCLLCTQRLPVLYRLFHNPDCSVELSKNKKQCTDPVQTNKIRISGVVPGLSIFQKLSVLHVQAG